MVTESAFCEEFVQGIESAGIIISGTIDESSFDCAGTPTRTWVVTPIEELSGSLVIS